MKIRLLVSLALVACVPALAFAEQSSATRYEGNELGVQICRAVVNDDVAKLRMLLRSYRQTVSYGYMFKLDKSGVAKDFTCNNMNLEQFSLHVGAQKVAAHFAGDTGAEQSQLAASGSR